MKRLAGPVVVAIGLCLASAGMSPAQTYEEAVVEAAGQVLNEIMAIPIRQIPQSLLADSQALAIIPNLIKGGLVVGVRHGRGVLVVRDDAGHWKAPVFVTLTGGSFGWQIGVQATDVILVFKTRNSVSGLMRGKFTLGVDAAIAAGPVGREASAATDAWLKAEIYSYSRSRGLFAGLALDGSALQVDARANSAYYGTAMMPDAGPGSTVPLPPSARKLLEQVARHTRTSLAAAPGGLAPSGPAPLVAVPPRHQGLGQAEALRGQLAHALGRLDPLLDDTWKKYLALPAEVYREGGQPAAEAVTQAMVRFDIVSRGPQYQPLARRPEFQSAHELLKRYADVQTQQAAAVQLPAPPK